MVFICEHDAEHAMGLAVNRPIEGLSISRLLGKLQVATSARPLEIWC